MRDRGDEKNPFIYAEHGGVLKNTSRVKEKRSHPPLAKKFIQQTCSAGVSKQKVSTGPQSQKNRTPEGKRNHHKVIYKKNTSLLLIKNTLHWGATTKTAEKKQRDRTKSTIKKEGLIYQCRQI